MLPATVLLMGYDMPPERSVTLETLYELHREWNALIADRDAIRARPYDDDAETALIVRLEEHRARLQSTREALLRQCVAVSDRPPKKRRSDLAVTRW